MSDSGECTVTRRTCLLGALLAPFAGAVTAMGLGQVGRLDVMGPLNRDLFTSVPNEDVGWMICQGWKVIDKQDDKHGWFRMKLELDKYENAIRR